MVWLDSFIPVVTGDYIVCHTHIHMYIAIYIYMCVCVYVFHFSFQPVVCFIQFFGSSDITNAITAMESMICWYTLCVNINTMTVCFPSRHLVNFNRLNILAPCILRQESHKILLIGILALILEVSWLILPNLAEPVMTLHLHTNITCHPKIQSQVISY